MIGLFTPPSTHTHISPPHPTLPESPLKTTGIHFKVCAKTVVEGLGYTTLSILIIPFFLNPVERIKMIRVAKQYT